MHGSWDMYVGIMLKVYVMALAIAICTLADVDECASGTSECDQICHNNIGSYTCSCEGGYTLNDDGLSCDGILLLAIPTRT